MRNGLLKKGLVLGIIILLIIITISPATGIVINKNTNLEEQQITVEETSATNTQEDDVDWWPMLQHDPQNTGYSTSTGLNTNNVLWSFTAKDEGGMLASTAVVDGRVYVGPLGWEKYNYRAHVYCLDTETGDVIWQYPLRFGIHATPAVVDGKVYVCTGLWYLSEEYSRLGDVYCLDAEDGSLIWEYLDCGYIEGGPVVVDGKIYFATFYQHDEGEVYCLNAETGEEIWNRTFKSPRGPVAVSGGKVYVGLVEYKGVTEILLCLDALTGETIWSWGESNRDGMMSAPTVVDGKVYVATGGYGVLSPDDPTYFFGWVYCLDAENGDKLWKSEVEDAFAWCSPAVAYGMVYVGSGSYEAKGIFYCLDATDGSLIWQRSNLYKLGLLLIPPGFEPSAVADGKVYLSVGDELKTNLYCLDAFTGETIWYYKKLGFFSISNPPAIADGQLYIGFGTEFGRDGMIYCFADIDLNAPKAPKITGPTSVEPGVEYEYSFVSTDPNGDDVYYYITWGDGISEKWIGPYSSGETLTMNHTWSEKTNYEIRARAKDNDGLRGPIGILKINKPRNRATYNSLLLRFLEQFPILQKILCYIL